MSAKRIRRREAKAKRLRSRKSSARRVLPMETYRRTCTDEHGCITVRAHRNENLQVLLQVHDSDDAYHERWTQYEAEAECAQAYERAVEAVTNAPNPLPPEWLLINRVTQ